MITTRFAALTSVFLAAGAFVFPIPATADAAEVPAADKAPVFTRVRSKFEVGGDLKLAADARPSTLPMSVVATFDYTERRIDDGSLPNQRRALRYYRGAEAAIKVDKQASLAKLADQHRIIRAGVNDSRTSLSAATGHLTREELDLIDIPFNSLVLSRLLPEAGADAGADWKLDEPTAAMLLGLDAVSQSDVKNTLKTIKDGVAEIAIEGKLNGAIGGVATEIELKGKLHFDIEQRQPFSLVLLIKEQRSVGHAAPGLDVTAKLQVQIEPVVESPELSDEALRNIELIAEEGAAVLAYRSKQGGFDFLYDPRWRIIKEDADAVALRLVDRGELVAQCNIATLAKAGLKDPITLDSFQKDVQTSLGKSFGQFESARETSTPTGLRLLRTVALGTVSDLPIVWHYYLLIDRQGRRAAITFTMESGVAERFADADHVILDGFRFNDAQMGLSKSARR